MGLEARSWMAAGYLWCVPHSADSPSVRPHLTPSIVFAPYSVGAARSLGSNHDHFAEEGLLRHDPFEQPACDLLRARLLATMVELVG